MICSMKVPSWSKEQDVLGLKGGETHPLGTEDRVEGQTFSWGDTPAD